ncbi:MAG: PEP-CTERM sorting domain-containing protein [Candidatus Tectimicrobiota bacterium]
MMRPVYRSLMGLAMAWSLGLAANVCHATLIVQATVQPISNGLFHYAYSLTNTMHDVAIVSLLDAPSHDAAIDATLTAPPGFLASYDATLGIIDFLEQTSLFAMGTTISGFQFDSAAGPASGLFSTFSAITIAGDTITGVTQTQVVPEPGTLFLLAAGLAMLIIPCLRRIRLCNA